VECIPGTETYPDSLFCSQNVLSPTLLVTSPFSTWAMGELGW